MLKRINKNMIYLELEKKNKGRGRTIKMIGPYKEIVMTKGVAKVYDETGNPLDFLQIYLTKDSGVLHNGKRYDALYVHKKIPTKLL
jgi:hypothetical protein